MEIEDKRLVHCPQQWDGNRQASLRWSTPVLYSTQNLSHLNQGVLWLYPPTFGEL